MVVWYSHRMYLEDPHTTQQEPELELEPEPVWQKLQRMEIGIYNNFEF